MAQQTRTRLTDPRMGMSLTLTEREALKAARVDAQTRVDIRRQTSGKYVLTCEESGGGDKDIGHYVGYAPLAGVPFISSRKLVNLGINSIHRRIVASALVRFEVFRYKDSFVHVLVTVHGARGAGGGEQAMRRVLFRGRFGELDKDGIAKFPSEDGSDDYTIPDHLVRGFKAALLGTHCQRCQHASHFEGVGAVVLPESEVGPSHHAEEPKAKVVDTEEGVVASSPKVSRSRKAVAESPAA